MTRIYTHRGGNKKQEGGSTKNIIIGIIIALLVIVAIVGGIFSWRYYKSKQVQTLVGGFMKLLK
jgi:predicted negative regulator of RcsB-dependent stress response